LLSFGFCFDFSTWCFKHSNILYLGELFFYIFCLPFCCFRFCAPFGNDGSYYVDPQEKFYN
jgi:hypothetical protein